MKDKTVMNRRAMLLKGGKAAAAFGLAAFAGGSALSRFVPAVAGAGNAGFGALPFERAAEEALEFSAADTCTLTGALTLGPCYAANAAIVRRDITSGMTGLPVRLGFCIVRASDCQPVTNATVDVWHTNSSGIYSALTAQVCTTGQNVVNQNFCRGVQPTDSDGSVYFDTVFPGWYSSRTTHIHFTIRINGTEYVTSQFAFADRVSDFIYRKHPLYSARTLRTTNNTNDTVFSSSTISAFTFNTRYKDNQLQAFKTIAIQA